MLPVLILRGWGSKIENWQKFIPLLEKQGYKALSPDLPGFGKEPPPQNSWSINDYAEWVRDFCEKNNLSQVFLLGHSFGGGVAVKFISQNPGIVQKLILVGAAIVRNKKEAGKVSGVMKKLSFLPFYGFFRKMVYRFFVKSDYPLEEGVMKETYLNVIGEDLTGLLSQINIPVQIVWGEKDDYTPVKNAYLIKGKIYKASSQIFPGIGHNPHREIPEKFADIVINFLEK